MDQLTATALLVALVINFVALVLAFGWAIRNRRRAEPRVVVPPAPGESRPWWLDHAERAAASAPATAAPGIAPTAGVEPSRTLDGPLSDSNDHLPGAAVLESLEPATAWRTMLGREAARVSRYRRSATVVIADLEGTDRLAARLGVESVDRLLPAVAGTLRRESRATDRLVRLANARFGVLLPETDEVAAINWVERLRESTDLWLEASAVSLRLAFGWAELGPDADADAVVALALERLDAERRGLRPRARADLRTTPAGRGPDRPSGVRRADPGPPEGRTKATLDQGRSLAAG